jgi:hypothetical protein
LPLPPGTVQDGAVTPTIRLRALVFVAALALPACSGGLPPPRTLNDLARTACAVYFARTQGISVEDAARLICALPEVLAPFLLAQQSGEQTAGPEAELAAQKAGVAKK